MGSDGGGCCNRKAARGRCHDVGSSGGGGGGGGGDCSSGCSRRCGYNGSSGGGGELRDDGAARTQTGAVVVVVRTSSRDVLSEVTMSAAQVSESSIDAIFTHRPRSSACLIWCLSCII